MKKKGYHSFWSSSNVNLSKSLQSILNGPLPKETSISVCVMITNLKRHKKKLY